MAGVEMTDQTAFGVAEMWRSCVTDTVVFTAREPSSVVRFHCRFTTTAEGAALRF